MESIVTRNPASVVRQPDQRPRAVIEGSQLLRSLDLYRVRKISPKSFLAGFERWPNGQVVFVGLNGSSGVFGPEVSAAGEKLVVIKEGPDVVVSTFSPKPTRGILDVDSENRLVLRDVESAGRGSIGLMQRVEALVGLKPKVDPEDEGRKLLHALLEAMPTRAELSYLLELQQQPSPQVA